MLNMFFPGQKVKCIEDHTQLTLNEIYTVQNCTENFVYLEEVQGPFDGNLAPGWFHSRFVPIPKEKKSVTMITLNAHAVLRLAEYITTKNGPDKKIESIRDFRHVTGCALADAKNIIEVCYPQPDERLDKITRILIGN